MDDFCIPETTDRSAHAFVRRWSSRIALAAAVALLVKSGLFLLVWILGIEGVAVEDARQGIETYSVLSMVAWGLILAPLVETLLMGWFILLMQDLGLRRFVVVLISATIWGALHQLRTPMGWAAGIGFAVFSILFIERNRTAGDGYSVTVMSHSFFNAIAIAVELGTRST